MPTRIPALSYLNPRARVATPMAIAVSALLVAGCVAPAPALAPAPPGVASWSAGGDDGAQLQAASSSPVDSARGCGALLLEDRQQLLTGGGQGGKPFALPQPCLLKATLTLDLAAGNVAVLVKGPEGDVFDLYGTVLQAPGVFVWYGRVDDRGGIQAPGDYLYSFEVEGAADFTFRVEAVP